MGVGHGNGDLYQLTTSSIIYLLAPNCPPNEVTTQDLLAKLLTFSIILILIEQKLYAVTKEFFLQQL